MLFFSIFRLCESDCNSFDPYLNLQRLNEVLLTILPMIRSHLLRSYTKIEVLTHEVNNLFIGNSYSCQNDNFKEDKISKLERHILDKEEDGACSIENSIKKSHSFVSFSLYEEIISLHLLMNIGKPEVIFEILELPKGVR